MRTQIRAHVKQMLDRRSNSFKDIISTLQIYHDNISEDEGKNRDDPGAISQRDILRHLIVFLEGC